MTEEARPIPAGARGVAWVRESLLRGHLFSAAVLASIDLDSGRVVALMPESADADSALATPEWASVTGCEVGYAALVVELDGLVDSPSVLFVEDELARATDSVLPGDAARRIIVPPDRFVHWLEMAPGSASEVPQFLCESSSGYPTNAFLVRGRAAELLSGGERQALPESIVRPLLAVIVSAFDAESWMVWRPGTSVDTVHT